MRHVGGGRKRYELVGLVASLALLLAACGGSANSEGDDETVADVDTTTQAGTPASASTSESPATTADSVESETPSNSGTNTAAITVGDRTYEFEWETDAVQLCDPDLFGSFVARSASTSDVQSFEADFPPPDDPELITAKIEVNDPENDLHWTADPEETTGTMLDEWEARVDSHQIDGDTVSGSATFVNGNSVVFTDTWEADEAIPGTFEITCARED